MARKRSSRLAAPASSPYNGASPSDSVGTPESRRRSAASTMQDSRAPGVQSGARRMRSSTQPPSVPVGLNVAKALIPLSASRATATAMSRRASSSGSKP